MSEITDLRVFPQDVMEATGISVNELVLITAKMFRMKLRPTLVDCLIALRDKEVDPETIIEAIKADELSKNVPIDTRDKNKDWSTRNNYQGHSRIRSSNE